MSIAPGNSERSSLAQMVMRAFDLWCLPPSDQLSMLGLPPSHQSALSLYRQGKPLGMSRDLLDRVGHILSIHKNLRIIFPKNREVVYSWMTRQNLEFSDLSPVEIVRKYGVSGLLMIRAYLDRQRGN